MIITTNYPISNNTAFGRKPNPAEMKVGVKAVKKGLSILNKQVGIILHNSSVPAKTSQNTGIGSLLSATALTMLVPFLKNNGVSTIQQEPNNYRKQNDFSPYSPISMDKNIYMIPLEKLVEDEYANILSQKTFEKIVNNNPKKRTDRVDYNYVRDNYNSALKEAYETFKQKVYSLDALTHNEKITIENLKHNFEIFKKENYSDIEASAIYQVLTDINGNDYWKNWNEIDKNLYSPKNDAQKLATEKRFNEIRTNYNDDIDFYIFKQMIVEKEIDNANKKNAEYGIKIIADSPVAFAPVEEWQHQDLFMDGLSLGCPPDSCAPEGQRWGFSVIKPEKMFNSDGSLGKGGLLMQKRYENMFKSSPGGVRIDHIIGLIDPFVYTSNEPMNETNSGKLYSSPNSALLGKYAKHTYEEYAAIMQKIVLPAAEKYGLTKDDIICEDLGCVSPPVQQVMDNMGLTGIALGQYNVRGRHISSPKVMMLGSHDNPSYIEYTNNLFNNDNALKYKSYYLAEDTIPIGENFDTYLNKIRCDKNKFTTASFVEMFTSPIKKIQIFFTDFFGLGKRYNTPGTTENCWTLRLNDDFEKLYYDNVKKGLGFNIAETLLTAIKHKGEAFVEQNRETVNELESLNSILKE